MKDLKVGDDLIAVSACNNVSSLKATLTMGKAYPIKEVDRFTYCVANDDGRDFCFYKDQLKNYFKMPDEYFSKNEEAHKFYPFAEEIEMLVWDNYESKAKLRTVFGRKNGHFLSWSPYQIFVCENWIHAKPLPKTVTVTMQEIAEWKGADVEQIKIEK